MMCLQLRLKMSYSLCFIFHVSCCFISVGKTPASIKRRINQYPARLSGGLQSPTEINAQLHNAPQEHCYACIGTRGCAGIRFGRCQLALTRIPRQFSRARIELSGYKLQTFRGKPIFFAIFGRSGKDRLKKKDFIPSDLLSGIKLSQLNTKSLIEAPLWRAGGSGSRAVPLYKSLSADAEPVCSERLLFMKLHHAMSPA